MNTIIRYFFALTLLFSLSFSCWGTRPLAMGGAFTGVADDANAVYWNPAGLSKIENIEGTGMLNVSAINNSNYDLYFAGAGKEKSMDIGLAGTYVYDITDYGSVDAGTDIYGHPLHADIKSYTSYYQGGIGKEVLPGLSVGLSGKIITFLYEAVYDSALYGTEQDSFGIVDADFGVLYDFGPQVSTKNTMFSFGILVQNFLDSKTNKYDITYPTNVRPGLAYRPIKQILIAAEEYDATGDHTGSKDLRAGIEFKPFDDLLALRTGIYHANTKEMRARTYGIGLTIDQFTGDITAMDWEQRDNDGNKVLTLFVGGGLKF